MPTKRRTAKKAVKKTRKTTSRKSKTDNVFSIAKRIRKRGEEWQDAIQRAKRL